MSNEAMCLCLISSELASDAETYARSHLAEGRSDATMWVTEYVCPRTGTRWLMDYPNSEMHGGGPPRLRTFATVARQLRDDLALTEFLLPGSPLAQELRTLLEGVAPDE